MILSLGKSLLFILVTTVIESVSYTGYVQPVYVSVDAT